jgi:predicted AAA+ superfamily ATPase
MNKDRIYKNATAILKGSGVASHLLGGVRNAVKSEALTGKALLEQFNPRTARTHYKMLRQQNLSRRNALARLAGERPLPVAAGALVGAAGAGYLAGKNATAILKGSGVASHLLGGVRNAVKSEALTGKALLEQFNPRTARTHYKMLRQQNLSRRNALARLAGERPLPVAAGALVGAAGAGYLAGK